MTPNPDLVAIARAVSDRHPAAAPVRLASWLPFGRDRLACRFTLGNGLSVIAAPDGVAPLVSFQVWYGVGSRHEQAGRTGIAHLFEHLMFKGTHRHPHAAFDRLLERAGAQANAATWLDWTFYYENLPSWGLDLAAELEADRMTGLILTPEQVEAEREVVKNERSFRVDHDPDGAIEEALFEELFPTHPYGKPTLGFLDDIQALTMADCLDFYRTWYSPGNATLVIAGDADPGRALDVVARHFGAIPAVAVPRLDPPPEADRTSLRTRELVLPIATERVRMGWRTVPAAHPDSHVLEVVNEILFANESSRLYQALVEDREIASDVDGSVEPLALDGVFIADVVLDEGRDAGAAVDVVLDGIDRLAADGPGPRELERARNHLEGAFLRSLSTVGSRATQLGSHELVSGDYQRMFGFVDAVRSVTADDVARVAGAWLRRDRASVVFGRPARGGQAVGG